MKAFILVCSALGKVEEVMEDITSVVNVNNITHVTGVYDVIVELEREDQDSINDDTMKIKKVYNIRSTMTLFGYGNV